MQTRPASSHASHLQHPAPALQSYCIHPSRRDFPPPPSIPPFTPLPSPVAPHRRLRLRRRPGASNGSALARGRRRPQAAGPRHLAIVKHSLPLIDANSRSSTQKRHHRGRRGHAARCPQNLSAFLSQRLQGKGTTETTLLRGENPKMSQNDKNHGNQSEGHYSKQNPDGWERTVTDLSLRAARWLQTPARNASIQLCVNPSHTRKVQAAARHISPQLR
ncbi:hypothetical protein SKAU_G00124010 [Synaphobranchus kaupii]|uniref:Uncharacterized protein n=1 Tax=Synaphobranchus kaupii TaxID=118154 RepID=A0A9Q1FPR6_SYNKA|nr:hypothetical protein SKAU_G00124010 [Synaphobranchus kaupii]